MNFEFQLHNNVLVTSALHATIIKIHTTTVTVVAGKLICIFYVRANGGLHETSGYKTSSFVTIRASACLLQAELSVHNSRIIRRKLYEPYTGQVNDKGTEDVTVSSLFFVVSNNMINTMLILIFFFCPPTMYRTRSSPT